MAKSGPPPRGRLCTVEAYKALLAMKKPNYPRLATKFCECGKLHDHRCADRLRKRIEELKVVLSDLDMPLTA